MPTHDHEHQDGTFDSYRHPTMPSSQGSSNSSSAADVSTDQRAKPKRWVKRYRTEVSASLSSVLSTVTAFPLDSVKTRMQTYKYSGFLDCVRHTYQTERLRGFFRGACFPIPIFLAGLSLFLDDMLTIGRSLAIGVTAPIASITLVRTVSFSIYQRSKYVYSDWLKRNFGIDALGHVNTKGTYPSFWSIACFGAAGATAGSGITFVACESGLASSHLSPGR